MVRLLPVLYCLSLLLLNAPEGRAEDWPRFRGANGSGFSSTSQLPSLFGPDKNLAWKVDVPPGHSSPVICGTRLYITSFDEQTLRTHAFDTRTGRLVWARELPRKYKAKHHSLNNPASPSPACDNRGVVVFFAEFGIATYSSDGKPAWTKPHAALTNNHGMSSSPVLAADLVLQILGADPGSKVLAVNRRTGRTIWQTTLSGVTYSTPAVTPDGQVIVLSTGELISFDVKTGKRRWWVEGLPYQPKSSPILSADGKTVFYAALSVDEGSKAALSSFEKLLGQFDVNNDERITAAEMRERKGPAGAFPQIDMNGDGFFTREEQQAIMKIAESPHTVAAVSSTGSGNQTARLAWALRKGVPNVSSPIRIGDVLYLVKEGGIMTSINTADGTVVREGRIRAAFGPAFSSPVTADGKIYVAAQDGKVTVIKATPQWEVLTVNDLGEDCFATPAIVDGYLFIRTKATLWCFRESNEP